MSPQHTIPPLYDIRCGLWPPARICHRAVREWGISAHLGPLNSCLPRRVLTRRTSAGCHTTVINFANRNRWCGLGNTVLLSFTTFTSKDSALAKCCWLLIMKVGRQSEARRVTCVKYPNELGLEKSQPSTDRPERLLDARSAIFALKAAREGSNTVL